MSDDGGDKPPDFFLDDQFVAGARYTELSATQRAEMAAAEAKVAREAESARRKAQQRQRRSEVLAKRRPLISLGVLILLGVLVWQMGRSGGGGSSDTGPKEVHAYYAVPAGAPTSGPTSGEAVAAIRNEIGVVQGWLEDQTSRSLRFVGDGERVTISTKQLEDSAVRLVNGPSLVAEAFRDADGNLPADTLVLVFVPVALDGEARCPDASAPGLAIVWLGSCGEAPSTGTEKFGEGATVSLAHQLVHALGAVRPCAPHYGNDGHVTDDPADLMFSDPDTTVVRDDIVLDPGRDDYYETGKKGCDGIEKSRAWK